ncbi:hypothetical protein [Sphingomonas sp. TREG-RG-20F-R18-01]|uniref:hypothetical protein n=1 Tax=Sphingomonas sp. TREG-RG-20F-R18-01 TaxID=2914982 RepID=UPI001F575F0B|nr:hypothetical protein [Sphingomonas sp. TREG-RG-20F-R18-01]
MAKAVSKAWDGATVRKWLDSRVVAARSEQVSAERGGRDRQDDCDKAAAEEMVCALLKAKSATPTQAEVLDALAALLDRAEFVWAGVYNDTRFDRHVRAFAKKVVRMAKASDGFENVAHYQ